MTEAYGFTADTFEGAVRLADCMGGGTLIEAWSDKDDLTQAVQEFISSRARDYAEAIVEELGITAGSGTEPGDDEAQDGPTEVTP